MTSRECKNGCGRIIEWNNEQRYFVEVANGQRHMCPNYKKGMSVSSTSTPFKPNDLAGKLAELETEVAAIKADNMELHKTLANLGVAVAQMSFKKATEVITDGGQTTEVVTDD